jgi:hypothetical protein
MEPVSETPPKKQRTSSVPQKAAALKPLPWRVSLQGIPSRAVGAAGILEGQLAKKISKMNTESTGERQAMSYAEIGIVFGISAERVRQIEQRALKKLRKALCKQGVKSGRF